MNKNALAWRIFATEKIKVTRMETKLKKAISHLLTSSAFVLRPFAGSPLHFNQNFNSSFFSSDGFRPHREAPGISFSSRSEALNEVVDNAAMFDFLVAFLASLWCYSYHFSRAVRHYESRVYMEQSTANSNSFKIAQKTAFEVKGRLYTTGKVIQRLFTIDLYT